MSSVLRQIRTGELLFFRGTRPHSRAIEWYTGPYSHVAIAVRVGGPAVEGPHTIFVIEALEALSGGCVRLYPLWKYIEECHREGCAIEVYSNAGSEAQRSRMVGFALDRVGDRYVSWFQLLWSFVRVNKWVRSVFGLPANLDPSRVFCSELIAEAAMSAGLLSPDDNPAEDSPSKVSQFDFVSYSFTLLAGRAAA